MLVSLFLILSTSIVTSMIVKLKPESSGGSPPWLWSNPLSWAGDVVPTADDDVVVDFTAKLTSICLSTWHLSVDVSASCKSLLVLSGSVNTQCASPVRIEAGVTLAAEVAWFRRYSRLFLDGGSLVTNSTQFDSSVFVGGNGTISGRVTANNTVFVAGSDLGLYFDLCLNCWPGYPQLSKFGDLSFPLSLSLSGVSILALFGGSSLQYSPRAAPGFNAGTIFAQSLFIDQPTFIVAKGNVSSSNPVLKWGTVNFGASFIVNDNSTHEGLGIFCIPVCYPAVLSDLPLPIVCSTTSGTGLSILLAPVSGPCLVLSSSCVPLCTANQTCVAATGICQIVTTMAPESTLSIALAVAIPTAVILGIGIAVLAKVCYMYKVKHETARMNVELKANNLESLKSSVH